MKLLSEEKPAIVPEAAMHQGEACKDQKWKWVERTVWTGPMLEALDKGVKGGKWHSLIDKVYKPENLKAAWKRVKTNKGSAGTDHQSVGSFEQKLSKNLEQLNNELQEMNYEPRPIRRVYIDKPGSKEKRPLGIPTVRDRVVQTALRNVMEPIFENEFKSMSYGFRPGRGCKDALREVGASLKEGYTHIVDADIKAYFDSIPHGKLMREVEKKVSDGRILSLIEAFLKQGILEDMKVWEPEGGTPQGAVISPMLAHIYLHPVDEVMTEAGYRMIRYADDFVIMCRSREEAEAGLEKVKTLLEERGLTMHPEKTRLVDMQSPKEYFEFLGYHFEGKSRWPRKKSIRKFKDTIRKKTPRNSGKALMNIILEVNATAQGWFIYFKHSNKWTFPRLDSWIRRRLRSILRKRSKRKGISRGEDHNRWPNRYFHDRGLFCLTRAYESLLQPSRR